MFRFSLLTTALALTGFTAAAAPRPVAPPDSIGVEYRNNMMLIKHRVGPGETLYGLARRYKVPVEQIVEANSGQKGALVTGQIVLVPRNRVVLNQPATPRATAATTSAPARTLPTDSRGNRIYRVEPGVTLFAIARRFQTTPAELSRLNGFPANYNVRVGETVIVAAGTGSAPSAARPAAAPVAAAPTRPAPTARPERDDTAEREARETREREARERAARERARDSATAPAVTPASPATEAPDTDRGPSRASEIVRRVSESGLATAIQTDASDKYLALHKTAPVGTIMQVRNIMNGQSVYVRVIGPLPDTGENTNILVRLSKKAVQRLATPDQRFRVETSYVP
ncbi:LysM peptidoglycan-binding domain-containing protein [Hymenobacter sp. 5516J-16]|uniref:LysM peptidoglycan-binding domain-containing protein n=1 Tax=Hymenobacter sublimis TaxID=2933777 RepID=A0ABY4J6T7_9BACT|nr:MULTISPECIES: LysM peptidoglycan-binding domain-containing protein [Hymenobacter]UOQ77544.1 LysM peptidoglycan-binding domain-containing protein [Hymenobacter sp. 5516J-16]UPL47522.1 LysM peptidoglycan-binding domain-containing protein [Hymenobacter sublimis]